MAEEKKPIDLVTTFVAELPGLPLEESLKKFQGRRTLRTVAAARRISAKKRKEKIPRNLLRQLFRLTGGFKMEGMKPSVEKPSGEELRSVRIGDMEVVFGKPYYYGPKLWISHRGRWIAHFDSRNNSGFWVNNDQAQAAAVALGIPYLLGEKK